MPKITFIAPDGTDHICEGVVGETLMEVARARDVPNVIAECGGAMACATCHVLIDAAWTHVVGAPGSDEDAMLEFGTDRQPNSRLSCQIELTKAMDGLVVRVPEIQG